MNILLALYLNFFYIGALSFGGGISAIPLVESQIVLENAWLSYEEFTSLITIAEMTPGPIAVNAASFVGVRMAGPIGALVSTLGVITPSIIIVGLLAIILFKNKDLKIIKNILMILRPIVVCLILSAALRIINLAIFKTSFDITNATKFIIAFYLLRVAKFSPIKTMLCVGVVAGIIITIF